MAVRPLIVRLRNWVGDVVLSVPLLQRLDAAGYQLQLLGRAWAQDLLAGQGWPVQTLAPQAGARIAQWRSLRQQALAQDPAFDRRINALVLPFSLSSAFEMRVAGLRGLGYRHEGRRWLLARSLPHLATRHEMALNWDLGSALLGQAAPLPDRLHLRLAPRHEAAARQLQAQLGLRPGYVVLCPFAGGTFEKLDKNWPAFPHLAAEALPSFGRDLLICPGPGDEESQARARYPGCHVALGVGLGTYAALLRDAALVIANDTGPGHLAAAVGAPLVSVLGPTDPARWAAVGPAVRIVRKPGGWPTLDDVLDHVRPLLAAG